MQTPRLSILSVLPPTCVRASLSFTTNTEWIYQGNGDVEGAIARYRVAVDRKSDLAPAWLNLGVGLAALGREDEAVAAYEVQYLLALLLRCARGSA